MAKVLALGALVWLAFLPPLFTGGACTAQFERESARLEADRKAMASVQAAIEYLKGRGIPSAALTQDECRRRKPRNLASCPAALVIAKLPVDNLVCNVYRDDEIRVQLTYDELGRLARITTEMNPFKTWTVPFTQLALHWAR